MPVIFWIRKFGADLAIDIKHLVFKQYFIGLCIVLLPWILVLLLREVGPIEYSALSIDFKFYLFIYLSANLVFFTLGFLINGQKFIERRTLNLLEDKKKLLKTFFYISGLFAILFPIFSLYDFLAIKGASFATIIETRELEHITGPRNSFIGAVIALLSGAPPIFFTSYLIMADFLGRKKQLFCAAIYIITFSGFSAMFLSGGRNPFFIGLLFIVIFYIFFIKGKERETRQARRGSFNVLIYIVLIALGIAYSMYLFVERSIVVGVDPNLMVGTLATNYDLSIYEPEFSNNFFISLYAIFVYLIFYITHALNYINEYFIQSYEPMLYGAYSIPQIFRLVDVTFGSSFFDDSRSSLFVNGAYLSLPGSFYLDFGFAGSIFVGCLLSLIFGILLRQIAQLYFYKKMIFTFLIVMFIFSPIYCVFGISNGFSIIFIIIIFIIISINTIPGNPPAMPGRQ